MISNHSSGTYYLFIVYMRVEGARRLLKDLHRNFIVIDEKWLYSEPSQSKENVRAWVDPGGNRPRLARRKITDRKWHIIVAMNFRSDYYFEVVEKPLMLSVIFNSFRI